MRSASSARASTAQRNSSAAYFFSWQAPDRIRHFAVVLTQGELPEDPHDLIATRLLHSASSLTGGAVRFGAIYLLTHGAVKVVLVIALLLDKLWAYPWMIGFLILFIGYQLYRIALHPSAGLVALSIFEALVLALTAREYRRKRQHRTEHAGAAVD